MALFKRILYGRYHGNFFYKHFILYVFWGLVCVLPNLFLIPRAYALELSLAEQAYIKAHPEIRVHNETDWPPFNFNRNGKPQGISIDVMNRIAKISGLKVRYVTGPSWNVFMAMMANDRLDVMLNIVDLPERREMLAFTTPYAKSLTGVYVRSENRRRYFSFNDLERRTIAVPAGFDLEINLAKFHPEVRVLPVRDILACIDAVHSGKADAFMEEIGVVDYIISQRMISDVKMAFQVNEAPFVSNLSIATAKDNALLCGVIQKSLNAISDEDLHQIRQKWLLNANRLYERSMVRLTVAEKEYLFHHRQVKICVDPSWAPLDFITEKGTHGGLSADLIQRVSERVGVTPHLVPTVTWEQSLTFLREGRCEAIPLMNETSESGSYIDFSRPYFSFPTVVATRRDAPFIGGYSDLYGKTLALQAHFFITEHLRKHHPQIRIVEVENTREALRLVSGQKVFATIDGLPNIVNTLEALALENVKISGAVPQENRMKLGVRKGNSLLLSVFNKGIATLSEKEKMGLYKKWFDIEVQKPWYSGEPLSLAIFDIDHFKSVNDTFGHMAGDKVLKNIGEVVRTSIRKNDHIGRWGGEEFLIVMPNTRHHDAARVMASLKTRISEFDFGIGRPVIVSIGLGQLGDREKAGVFLTRVDNCLYKAKDGGRNRIVSAEAT